MKVSELSIQDYTTCWLRMREFTTSRREHDIDELWLLEHFSVFTQGQAGKSEHLLSPGNIEVVQSDRGGQITYHGPGQLVAYVLMDLRRRKLGIRDLVSQLEQILINTLALYQIEASRICSAPGVYVKDKKIASIGLRVKNGCTYHGIALNVDMDLSPFLQINPCGFAKMEMTQMSHFQSDVNINEVKLRIKQEFLNHF